MSVWIPGTLVKLSVEQSLFGQLVINTCHFQVTSVSGTCTPRKMVPALADKWYQAFFNQQTQQLTYNRALLEEPGDIDQGIYSYEVGENAGTRTGDPMPAFCAIGIRLNRATRLTRNGQKRIAGLTEDMAGSGELVATVMTGLQASAESVLDGIFTIQSNIDTASAALTSVIYGGPIGVAPYYKINNVNGFTINPLVTSQVSRRPRAGS